MLNYLIQEFYQLEEALRDPNDATPFDPYDHGYIVLLEPGDNVRDRREVGLHRMDEGLLGSLAEYVERVRLEDGIELYRVGVLYNNDYMMFFYTVGSHDEEVDAWLKAEAEFGEVITP
ncbi:MAG: hypothetical protein H0Z37_07525 [Firmicutes bacterium]|nr:hypothetical protein [Bacillota bacterium]